MPKIPKVEKSIHLKLDTESLEYMVDLQQELRGNASSVVRTALRALHASTVRKSFSEFTCQYKTGHTLTLACGRGPCIVQGRNDAVRCLPYKFTDPQGSLLWYGPRSIQPELAKFSESVDGSTARKSSDWSTWDGIFMGLCRPEEHLNDSGMFASIRIIAQEILSRKQVPWFHPSGSLRPLAELEKEIGYAVQ